jgi:hypothetical protein
MRMIMAVSAREGLAMRQFDILTAFLNGELEKEVEMRPPAGAEELAGGGCRVLHLKKALYGLRQASCLEQAPPPKWQVAALWKGLMQPDADSAL